MGITNLDSDTNFITKPFCESRPPDLQHAHIYILGFFFSCLMLITHCPYMTGLNFALRSLTSIEFQFKRLRENLAQKIPYIHTFFL